MNGQGEQKRDIDLSGGGRDLHDGIYVDLLQWYAAILWNSNETFFKIKLLN